MYKVPSILKGKKILDFGGKIYMYEVILVCCVEQ